MPRKTKEQREQEQHAKQAEAAAALLAARPFAPESTDPYAGRDDAGRKAVADAIAAAKESGASGDEMRERFGARLSGPARRKVLREHGYGTASGHVARSYSSYRDGESRTGTRHAREHGARAGALAAAAREAAAAEEVASLSAKDCRALVREAGGVPAKVRGGDEGALRAQTLAALLVREAREEGASAS